MDKLVTGCLYLMVFGGIWLLVDAYMGAGPLNIPGVTKTASYLIVLFAGVIGLLIRQGRNS